MSPLPVVPLDPVEDLYSCLLSGVEDLFDIRAPSSMTPIAPQP
ncbi:unnamed protein product [Acidithrix sp. C25]|nr:unnamed protein product [Acidithrix sp. C25]